MLRRIPILLYHSIATRSSPRFARWVVQPAAFQAQMDYLVAHGYQALTVSELVDLMGHADRPLPERPVVLTFDDGFADFHEAALPVLERRDLVATLFLTTAYLDGTARWLAPDGEGGRPMLSWAQAREVADRGVEIGAHSHTHPRLDELRPEAARREIARSRELLEDRLERPVPTFAYPHGYAGPVARRLVQEAGYRAACGVRHAMSSPRDDVWGLCRLVVDHRNDTAAFASLLQGVGTRTAPLPETVATKAWRAARRSARTVRGGSRA